MAGSAQQIVLHVDVDEFFVQVEQLAHPELVGKPVAIQQHYDTIAMNWKAKMAGVVKHMPPPQARALLAKCGGVLHHVHCSEDGRVSYRPYRETSAALMRLMRRFVNAAVVERASIDEAYVLCRPPTAMLQVADVSRVVANPSAAPKGGATSWDLSMGMRLAQGIREAAASELGLTVSCGVAPNKLLAKLASRKAKPDGVHVVESAAYVDALLQATPAGRLPGMGGKVAEALLHAGVRTVLDLRKWAPEQLAAAVGISMPLATTLTAWGAGADDTPVMDKGPPKSLQVQMSLTPVLLPAHPGAPVLGGGGSAGKLVPLVAGAPDALQRLTAVLRSMVGDLLGRVVLDRHTHDRWPAKLALSLAVRGASKATRSCGFPTPGLLEQGLAAATQQREVQQGQQPQALQQQNEARGQQHWQGQQQVQAPPPPPPPPPQQQQQQEEGVVAQECQLQVPGQPKGQALPPQQQGQQGEGSHGASGAQTRLPLTGGSTPAFNERSFSATAALVDAVMGLLLQLAQQLMAGCTGEPITQVAVAASSFVAFDTATNTSIRRFFGPMAVAAKAAKGVQGAASTGAAANQQEQEKQQAQQQEQHEEQLPPQQQPHKQQQQHPDDAAAGPPMKQQKRWHSIEPQAAGAGVPVPAPATGEQEPQPESPKQQQQQQQQPPPRPKQRLPLPSLHPPPPPQQLQRQSMPAQQEQSTEPEPLPATRQASIRKPAAQQRLFATSSSDEGHIQQQPHQANSCSSQSISLCSVLQLLASASCTAEQAEQQLLEALQQQGASRLLPTCS